MDNINAPQGNQDQSNPPAGGQPQGGDQPSGDQSQQGGGPRPTSQGEDVAGGSPDQDNLPAGGPPSDIGQDQGADSLKMPPDAGGVEGENLPPEQSPGPTPPGEAPPGPQEAGPPGGEGPVEDVFEGAESPGQDQGAIPPPEPGAPPEGPGDMSEVPPGETPAQDAGVPQEGLPPGEMPQGEVAPQSQPDFTQGPEGAAPGQVQPPKPGGSKVLPILLIILILIIGGVALAYFMNWISLPFLDNLLGREQPTEEIAPLEEEAEVSPYPEDDQRKNDLAQIKSALEKYFEDNQKYPVARKLENSSESTSVVYKALVPNYLETMPTDPLSPSKYYGYQSADGTSFELSAVLDNPDDAEGVKRGDLNLYILTNVSEVEGEPTEAETS